jgi:phospholipase C
MSGPNVGDLLTTAGVTWGFFEGGFNLSIKNSNGTTGCNRTTTSAVTGVTENDYIQHHEPFQFYPSTANPTHARPTSVSMIGYSDAANHQYDILDFFAAVSAKNYPAVSFLKAPGFEDGHAGYSDPLDEQAFIVQVVNFLQENSNDWAHTAIVIAYDDSDGWYDHQMSPILNQSATTSDALSGTDSCGTGTIALAGVAAGTTNAHGRCGHGPRLPLLVISPWAKSNFVDHTATDQSSILRFIEDNWLNSQRIPGSFDTLAGSLDKMFDFTFPIPLNILPYILNGTTGEVTF